MEVSRGHRANVPNINIAPVRLDPSDQKFTMDAACGMRAPMLLFVELCPYVMIDQVTYEDRMLVLPVSTLVNLHPKTRPWAALNQRVRAISVNVPGTIGGRGRCCCAVGAGAGPNSAVTVKT